jgi:hypothetical protein
MVLERLTLSTMPMAIVPHWSSSTMVPTWTALTFRSSTVALTMREEVSEMVTTEVLAAISSPGFMVRPMTFPEMEATAEQFARFFSAVSSSFRASSRLCWAE